MIQVEQVAQLIQEVQVEQLIQVEQAAPDLGLAAALYMSRAARNSRPVPCRRATSWAVGQIRYLV